MSDGLLVVIIAVALLFDFTNGFHDTANAVATSVSTRALTPRVAVLIAAVMNFVGAFTSTKVAKTVGDGLINTDPHRVTGHLVLAALIGAIAWNLFTWYLGLPSSSSHALVGGLVGAALAANGSNGVLWDGIWHKVALPGAISPLLGFAIAMALMLAIIWIFRRVKPGPLNRGFRWAQIASGSFMAFAHGSNDAQKTMGVIALALFTSHRIDSFYIPKYVIVGAGLAIAVGTYVGGWRIMRTMGTRIFNLEPPHGFAAQTTASALLYTVATKFGYPISTTHVISGAVMGAGSTVRLSAVRWGVAADILAAWLFTIPAAALVAAIIYELIGPLT
jgi:inorganic phosphate transporter, PiT family